jgi:hypothetical protein
MCGDSHQPHANSILSSGKQYSIMCIKILPNTTAGDTFFERFLSFAPNPASALKMKDTGEDRQHRHCDWACYRRATY